MSLQCPLCGQPVRAAEHTVGTTTGGRVHVHCADQAATEAGHRRDERARWQGGLAVGLVAGSWTLAGASWASLTAALCAGAHLWANAVWWRHTLRPLFRWRWLLRLLQRR